MLDSIFSTASECKESGHKCAINKSSVSKIYKPDLGIKDDNLKKEVFGNIAQPSLCDCAVVYSSDKLALLEIKCGKVTKKLLEEILKQLKNTYEIIKRKHIKVTKFMFICEKFDSSQTKKLLTSTKYKVDGKELIARIYKNQAININS